MAYNVFKAIAAYACLINSLSNISFALDLLARGSCCTELQLALGNAVLFPTDQTYRIVIQSYWSQQERNVVPSCIISPRNTQEVATAIQILSEYSISTDPTDNSSCPFAIKGAGHTPWAGSANIHNGVTIDLGAMKSVEVNPGNAVTSIGPGARWSDVYQVLDRLGLTVAGGRVADVGVGGLITGGGMSYLSPRYGFVCDQVTNFEVVLAGGKVVNANASVNSDLWFALKGGSNNFGVVTRFDLKTFPQGPVWGGTIYSPISSLDAQILSFVELNTASNYDVYASMISSYCYTSQQNFWMIANILVYSKPIVNPPIFAPFTRVQPQYLNTMRLTNMSDLTSEQIKNTHDGLRQLFITRTYGNDASFLKEVFSIANMTLHDVKHARGLIYSLAYQALPSSITSRAAKSGSNILGLDSAAGPLVLALQTVQWADSADDEAINAAVRSVWSQADAIAQRNNLMNQWIYLNYAAQDQDVISSYGWVNKDKLQKASRKYDPTGVFQLSVPGGWKLF